MSCSVPPTHYPPDYCHDLKASKHDTLTHFFSPPVHITRPRSLVAISNTQLAASQPIKDSGLVRDSFQQTPVMSTYLLAWVIGEFECVEGKTQRGEPIGY